MTGAGHLPGPAATPLTRLLRDAIGMRDGAVSAIRLRHAAAALCHRTQIPAAQLAARLTADPVLREQLIDEITVQESQFFRDASLFAALRDEILPALGDAPTIWSAACAHGQEAWSVAMLLAETGRRDFRILATDVSPAALDRARRARFAARELRGLSAPRRERFLVAGDGGFAIAPALRERVSFAAHNLIDGDLPVRARAARLVLLRNVLIYFDPDAAAGLLRRLARGLAPGAWVVLGGGEVLHPVDGLSVHRVGELYAYRTGAPASAGRSRSGSDVVDPGRCAAPDPRAAPAAVAAPRAPDPDPERLRADGERHAAAGEHAAAIACFRRLVYLDGDDLAARLALALAFEAAGEADSARRAYRATRAVLARRGAAQWPEPLAGFGIGEIRRLLAERLDDPEPVA